MVGGQTENEGYIEIKAFNYPWGGICDDGFRLEEANVICKMAGYPRGAEQPYVGSHFGNGNGPFLLDDLDCEGNENSILDCKFNPWRQHDCRPSEWAGVTCKKGEFIEREILINDL